MLVTAAAAAAAVAPARYIRFAEAQPILTELAGKLPSDLNNLAAGQLAAAWPAWVERHDKEIRARLDRGDEDTIVNWMLFGTSFTTRPKAVLGAVESATSADRELVLQRAIELISARLDDLVAALANPGTDERRLFARALFQKKGLTFATPAGREAVREYLTGAVMRVAQEQEQLDQELGATSGRDAIAEFVQRSRLFRTRGLSLDTSLVPNYALEQSLAEMKKRGLLAPGSIRRIAIVGPGLDFADKDVGFDFYPQQTLQPFAILDTLRRLGLATATTATAGPEIVLLDISPRILDHVTRARTRAASGTGYTLNLPLTKATPWEADIRKYWENFGNQIGAPAQAPTSKAIADQAELRAVRASAASVRRLSVTNLNIVTDRLDGQAFDLVIATNVFVYYDVLEQALAMANVDAMLKPGGYLLANFAAPELRSLPIRPIETITTLYARARDANENILDFIVWYKAHAN